MAIKTSAHYQREYRKRLREQGLVKKEIWILPEHAKHARQVEKDLREITLSRDREDARNGLNRASTHIGALYGELVCSALVREGQAHVELIEGADPSVRMVMHEYGDLPIFMTVSGEQIVCESVLWLAADVINRVEFNETVLRMHKYIPLSTISLEQRAGEDYYMMFGSLSSSSGIDEIVHEMETLAGNVIHATEAFFDLLKTSE